MNPRHRRLLIPGLLVILLVIVVASALANRADAAASGPEVVSRISDPRVTESSGLVLSRDDADLAYTVNDSGNAPLVFAVKVSTGAVVGTTTLTGGPFVDTEALSIDTDGTLWLADTGDNNAQRKDVALYSFAEPGPGSHTVAPTRYPLTYQDGAQDVETLLINPVTDQKYLLSKGLLGGQPLVVPDTLRAGEANEVAPVDATVPGVLTDGAFTPDGTFVVTRNYGLGYVLDPTTWEEVATLDLPAVKQGETLAMEPGGRSVLVGSEGADSPLIRVAFDKPVPAASPTPSATAGGDASDLAPPVGGSGFAGATWFWTVVVMALLAVISVAATRTRR